jgi:hypothetical protein|tara:strand:+ start:917 stop:1231 length:315 start_codon:yes stop_codon:yes gene_type:complete
MCPYFIIGTGDSLMDESLLMQYMVIGSLLLFSLLAAKLVSFLKRRKNNVILWATIFEGISMGLVNLDMYKEPETRIEKKARRDGKDELTDGLIDLESLPKSEKS